MIVNNLGKQLDSHCLKYLSETNKESKKNSLEEILRLTDNFSEKVPEYDQCPHWNKLRNEIFDIKETRKSPYVISDVPGKIYKTFAISREKPETRLNIPEAHAPAYIVNMPHCPKNNNLTVLIQQIELLQKQSFGESDQASREESLKRLRVVIGINRCHSLDSFFNKQFKSFLNQLTSITDKNVHFCAFTWAPDWVKNNDNAKADHRHIKRMVALVRRIDGALGDDVLKSLMGLKPVVPFQIIRERIKNNSLTIENARELRRGNRFRPEYLAVMDDDAITLRTATFGLFTHYDRLIELNPDLEMATTGYFMEDPQNEFVLLASTTDLIARQALAKYLPNAVYFPEPNLIVNIKQNTEESLKQISFLRKKSADRGGSLEYIGLLENAGLMKTTAVGKLVFGTKGAIQTTASLKIRIPQHMTPRLNAHQMRQKKFLASFRAFLQSSIHPRNCAIHICNTFPGNKCSGENRSSVAAIITTFDPKEYSAEFKNWLDLYKPLVKALTTIFNAKMDATFTEENYTVQAHSILKEAGDHVSLTALKIFLKNKSEKLVGAYISLVQKKVEPELVINVILAARNMGNAVYNYWRRKIAP